MKENKNICSETNAKVPASDLYGDILCKEEETGVEIPTEDAVEDAKDWVDQENRR